MDCFSSVQTGKVCKSNISQHRLYSFFMPLKPLIKLASLCNPCLINLWPEAALYSFLFNFHLPFCVLHIHFFSVHVIVRGGGIKLPENWIFRETDWGRKWSYFFIPDVSFSISFPSFFLLPRGRSLMGTTHTRFSALFFQTLMEHVTRGRRRVSLIYLADAELCKISAPITTLISPSKEPWRRRRLSQKH